MLRLPKVLKAGKHMLKVSFKPAGAKEAVAMKLAIRLTTAKARKASARRIAGTASAGPRIDRSALPAPQLPEGRRPQAAT